MVLEPISWRCATAGGHAACKFFPIIKRFYPQISQIFADYKETLSNVSACPDLLSHLRNLCNLWIVPFIFLPSSLDIECWIFIFCLPPHPTSHDRAWPSQINDGMSFFIQKIIASACKALKNRCRSSAQGFFPVIQRDPSTGCPMPAFPNRQACWHNAGL